MFEVACESTDTAMALLQGPGRIDVACRGSFFLGSQRTPRRFLEVEEIDCSIFSILTHFDMGRHWRRTKESTKHPTRIDLADAASVLARRLWDASG